LIGGYCAGVLGIMWEEYKAIVEYGKWLNEAKPLQYSVEEPRETEEGE
jgi:cytochrome c